MIPPQESVDQGLEKPLELPPPEEDREGKKKPGKAFPVVGIGASAGGLEPLEAFFANLHRPPEVDMAFVVHATPRPQA